jgi:ubiquinone/menaquinone biosynthesis C-methylase UbiE
VGSGGNLVGIDVSHFALTCGRKWQGPAFLGVVGDVRRVPLADDSVDVVTSQLLLHHFEGPEIVVILREAARVARRGVVIADLSRSWLAWGLTWLTTRLVSRSRIFHHDGPRSVRAAHRARELAEYAERAGLMRARVRRVFPFRLVLVWRKTQEAEHEEGDDAPASGSPDDNPGSHGGSGDAPPHS